MLEPLSDSEERNNIAQPVGTVTKKIRTTEASSPGQFPKGKRFEIQLYLDKSDWSPLPCGEKMGQILWFLYLAD